MSPFAPSVRLLSRRLPGLRLLGPVLLALCVSGHAGAQDNVVSRPLSGPDVLKQGRLTPKSADSVLPGNARPLTPAEKDANAKASGGLTLLERMGADLPALPPEKPYPGKADEAYGAYQRGLFLTAMEKALPRAQLGDAAAQTLLGELLSNGLGVKRDEKAAVFWYAQAAEHGDPSAMFKYALILMEGRLVKQDKARADSYMKKAADAGNASAAFNYAQLLVGAHQGPEGLKQAFPYYLKSAELGIADAQYAVSQIYMALPDMGKDHREKALAWLQRAARANFDTAQLDLGMWLINGTAGTRDAEAGFNWLKRAAEQGNIAAANKVAHLYINAVGTKPDPVEAAKWYVISRRAGLPDPELEDFFLGIEDAQQKQAIEAADAMRKRR